MVQFLIFFLLFKISLWSPSNWISGIGSFFGYYLRKAVGPHCLTQYKNMPLLHHRSIKTPIRHSMHSIEPTSENQIKWRIYENKKVKRYIRCKMRRKITNKSLRSNRPIQRQNIIIFKIQANYYILKSGIKI